MTILGIDPGYGTIGYGVVRFDNMKFTPVQYGAATTKPGMPMHLRLCEIYDDIGRLVDTFHPDEVAIEELFFSKNITTGIQVAQARGVILLALALDYAATVVQHEASPLRRRQRAANKERLPEWW